MKIKTSKLTGTALDWAVAETNEIGFNTGYWEDMVKLGNFFPSCSWNQGGSIIDREKICIEIGHDGVWISYVKQNYSDSKEFMQYGDSALVAAMRCYVSSKLGDTIEVPDELLK